MRVVLERLEQEPTSETLLLMSLVRSLVRSSAVSLRSFLWIRGRINRLVRPSNVNMKIKLNYLLA